MKDNGHWNDHTDGRFSVPGSSTLICVCRPGPRSLRLPLSDSLTPRQRPGRHRSVVTPLDRPLGPVYTRRRTVDETKREVWRLFSERTKGDIGLYLLLFCNPDTKLDRFNCVMFLECFQRLIEEINCPSFNSVKSNSLYRFQCRNRVVRQP